MGPIYSIAISYDLKDPTPSLNSSQYSIDSILKIIGRKTQLSTQLFVPFHPIRSLVCAKSACAVVYLRRGQHPNMTPGTVLVPSVGQHNPVIPNKTNYEKYIQ